MMIAVLLNVKYRGRKAARMALHHPLGLLRAHQRAPVAVGVPPRVRAPQPHAEGDRPLGESARLAGSAPLPAFVACMWVDIWVGIPFFALVFLAGMQAIPHELYESAHMDGAGAAIRSFFSITLAGIRELILISTLLSAIWTFNDFNVIFILTRAGPANSTNILITSVYMNAFIDLRFDWAAVQSVITFLILTIVSIIYARFYFKQE